MVSSKNSKLLVILRRLAGILDGTTLLLPVSLRLLRAKQGNFKSVQRRLTSAHANSKSASLQESLRGCTSRGFYVAEFSLAPTDCKYESL